jgi:alanine or glycine:cation symporter, AGCS family
MACNTIKKTLQRMHIILNTHNQFFLGAINISYFGDLILAGCYAAVLLLGVYLTLKSRFIQIRTIPQMLKLIFTQPRSPKKASKHSIDPRKALFTAMSTTIGIGNIVGPIYAITKGGPGALLWYVITSFLAGAIVFTEVSLAVRYRVKLPQGRISGGPMPYLEKIFSPKIAKIYALVAAILLVCWTTNQSQQLAELLHNDGVPHKITGAVFGIISVIILLGGIRVVAEVNEKIVPFMFILYTLSTSYIIAIHYDLILPAIGQVLSNFFSNNATTTGVTAAGFFSVLRFALAKSVQSNEAGVGTTSIPHSFTTETNPNVQAVLAIASVYSNTVICLLTGLCVIMVAPDQLTQPYPVGITIMRNLFSDYIPYLKALPIVISTVLFAFGTILGNFYNGYACFKYFTGDRGLKIYIFGIGIAVFLGSMGDMDYIWGFIDYVALPILLINSLGVYYLTKRHDDLYEVEKK